MTYLRDALTERVGEFIQLRRDIHRHPELAFEEHRTSDLVAAKLESWGYQVHRGLGGTGVVGTLKRGTSDRKLGIRADMDALPIQEATGAEWASARPGLMHACGHDGHTAMLLAAAKAVADAPNFDGTLNLIFQPAEEGGGGAVRMMDDGLFEHHPCDAVFAMHNMPGMPVGHLVFRDGAAMASSDYATIRIHGTGGHGAMPHRAADPLVAAASIVMALQTIVSRNVDPRDMAVITVGAIHGGEAPNVIPGVVNLKLTVRAYRPEIRAMLRQRITEVVSAQAATLGVQAEIDYHWRYPALVNDASATAFAEDVARQWLGEQALMKDLQPLTGSEDFSFMLEKCPGSYLIVGNGEGEHHATGGCMVHNPGYDFNDAILPIAASYWVQLVRRYLVAPV